MRKFGKIYGISLILTLLFSVSLVSCVFDSFNEEAVIEEEGEVSPTLTIEFEPQAGTLNGSEETRTAGNVMKNINSLAVVLFKENGEFALLRTFNDITETEVSRNSDNLPEDYYPVEKLSESKTMRADLDLGAVEVGNYYIYAIANKAVTENEVNTLEKLQSLKVQWNQSNISSNAEMFGYFMNGTSSNSVGFGFNVPEKGYEAHLVTINSSNRTLHAWLKRAASKVTIVYDGSELHNDILIYLHKVTIHDIPRECYLAQDNSPTSANRSDVLYSDGETLYYNSLNKTVLEDPGSAITDYQKWMRIGKGSNLKGAVDDDGKTHSETAQALYFYENLQGNYSDQEAYLKEQIKENVGTNINEEGQADFKDNVLCGSYIEVEGYYVSKHSPGISQGPIKYRFMLGQDTKYDYNAFRNMHYKLTMKFKGYANQVDWHIEYKEETPEIYVPDEFYVSYLYNKKAVMPFRVVGNVQDLEVEIVRNDWGPYDPDSEDEAPPQILTNSDEEFQWNRFVWANSNGINDTFDWTTVTAAYSTASLTTGKYFYGKRTLRYKDMQGNWEQNIVATPPFAGFLSLTVPAYYASETINLPQTILCESGTNYQSEDCRNNLVKYYYGLLNANLPTTNITTRKNTVPQNKRTLISGGNIVTANNTGRNKFTIEESVDENGNSSRIIRLPLWTRPFSIINISGFSGNNPYEAYQRKAIIRVRAKFDVEENGSHTTHYETKDIPVYQVRRIINPKGVWRQASNNTPFHVTLMQRRDATTSEFAPFMSEGPWRASITASNADFCFLTGASGDTDEEISFDINFSGNTADNQSHCALITVEYHGYTCFHTIFVRQGYDEPLEVIEGQGAWSSYSLYAGYAADERLDWSKTADKSKRAIGVLTKSPLALGTFFKRGNYDDGIGVINNDTFPKFVSPTSTGAFTLYSANANNSGDVNTSSSKTWGNIVGIPYTGTTANTGFEWANYKIHNREYALPTMEQYQALMTSGDVGFGVLYGSGASVTATLFSEAFGYKDENNTGELSGKGMRGVFAYNKTNANQVFFPIGFSGVGRRTIQNTDGKNGILRYGALPTLLAVEADTNTSPLCSNKNDYNEFRPICYNLPNNAGAIYWAKKAVSGNVGWDMNFADQNFSAYDYACALGANTTGYGKTYGDALPIKLVYVREISQ